MVFDPFQILLGLTGAWLLGLAGLYLRVRQVERSNPNTPGLQGRAALLGLLGSFWIVYGAGSLTLLWLVFGAYRLVRLFV